LLEAHHENGINSIQEGFMKVREPGKVMTAILSEPSKYIKKQPELAKYLCRLRSSGL
jgi:hypothetical protein